MEKERKRGESRPRDREDDFIYAMIRGSGWGISDQSHSRALLHRLQTRSIFLSDRQSFSLRQCLRLLCRLIREALEHFPRLYLYRLVVLFSLFPATW